MIVKNLKTEYRTNPIGIDVLVPRLSWETLSDERGWKQSAYQVICAKSVEDINVHKNLIWDSNQVETDKSVHVLYKGDILEPCQRVYWKVRVWGVSGGVSEWSEPAFWEMGLINQNEWQAKWIEPEIEEDTSVSTPCPYLRKSFIAKNHIKKATVYITAHGLYELSINGAKVSKDLFTPGWTSYKHRLQYQVYDVTDYVISGENAIGVILADGWYRGYLVWQGNKNTYGDKLSLLFQMKVVYSDGTKEFIFSDDSWRSNIGPVLKSDIYNGESYDARLELKGWNKPGYSHKTWHEVAVKNYGFKNIVSSAGVPVRITGTINPINKIVTPKGELVFDFGQNIVGWVKFSLKSKKGSKITLNYAEVLDQQGNFYTDNLREAKAEDSYIFKGEGLETYEPHFTFHGFRYIRVSDFEGDISPDDISARVVHSDMTTTGDFECSNVMINRLQQNIKWGLRGNFLDVPTDCPQRDERLGWTGDAQVFAPTACYNVDASSFYRKWMKDFIVDQKEDGSVPWVVPNVIENGGGTGWSDGFGATGWADAAVIIPWTVYRAYGDTRILSDQYDSMKAWVDYMIREAGESYIFKSGFHFGDWLSFAEYYTYNYNAPDYGYAGAYTEKELIATAYFYYTTSLMRKISAVLGKNRDSDNYHNLLPLIREAFHNEFLTQNGRLTSNTQTAYVLALSFGLLTEHYAEIAAKRLADDVNYFGHLTTGFLGTPLICQALTENGYPEIAYKLLFNDRYPSWLYPVTKGATTIWERWDGIKPDGTFQTEGMNSFNHYAYGAVGQWLYTTVAGIRLDAEVPGYKKIIIKPVFTADLEYAKASFQSIYGRIVSYWRVKNENIILHVEIPPNTTAVIFIPDTEREYILEGGIPVQELNSIKILEKEDDSTIIEVGSGIYEFTFPSKYGKT